MIQGQQWLVVGLTALGILAVLGWRKPTWLLLVVLVTFVVGPGGALRDHLGPDLLRWMVPAQQALLVFALLANLRRFGRRRRIGIWPLLAVLVLVLQSLLLARRSEILSIQQIGLSALALALPWTIASVVLEPHSRRRCALVAALLPMLSLGAGLALWVAGLRAPEASEAVTILRLPAATHPSWFGLLAFAGFALAGHEALRTRGLAFALLAVVDLAIAVAGGGRTAAVACLGFVAIYVLLAEPIRSTIRREGRILIASGAAVVTVLVLVMPPTPLLVAESVADEAGALVTSTGRERIWQYVLDFMYSPDFGQGLGATTLVGGYGDLPRNEYLRLLVETGIVGLTLYLAAIGFWGRQLLALVRSGDRAVVLALLGTLALIAAIDNLLTMTPTLVLFVYLDCIVRRSQRHEASRYDANLETDESTQQLDVAPLVVGSGPAPAGASDIPPPIGPPAPSLSKERPTEGAPQRIETSTNPSVGARFGWASPARTETPPKAIEMSMDEPQTLAARVRREIELGHLALAGKALGQASEELRRDPAVEGARIALELAEQAEDLPSRAVLLGRLEADEDDPAARIDLATALFVRKQPEQAIDLLLAWVRNERDSGDRATHGLLLRFFAALGSDHPVTVEGRRKLAAVLFA